MPKVIYENGSHYCWVYQDGDDYFLDTVCGGAGVYGVAIKMLPEEIVEFTRDPATVLELSRDLCFRPGFYEARTVDEATAIRLRKSV